MTLTDVTQGPLTITELDFEPEAVCEIGTVLGSCAHPAEWWMRQALYKPCGCAGITQAACGSCKDGLLLAKAYICVTCDEHVPTPPKDFIVSITPIDRRST